MARHVLALLLLASNTLLVVPQAVQNCTESDLPRDCQDLLDAGNTNNGVYTIYLNKRYGVRVWCDMETDGGGWTVTWNQYLHYLTSSDWYMLRVDIEDFDNNTRYSHYNIFSVGSAEGQYRAYVAGYTGDSGDDMSLCSGYRFSAKDRDYDANSGFDCAKGYRGGWWYAACHRANLNGLYLRGHTTSYANGVVTYSFRGYYYSLKTTKMMVRRGWRPPQSQALSP